MRALLWKTIVIKGKLTASLYFNLIFVLHLPKFDDYNSSRFMKFMKKCIFADKNVFPLFRILNSLDCSFENPESDWLLNYPDFRVFEFFFLLRCCFCCCFCGCCLITSTSELKEQPSIKVWKNAENVKKIVQMQRVINFELAN